MSKIQCWCRANAMLVISLLAAVVTAFFVPPDRDYLGYYDLKTLACLFCVLAVVGALRDALKTVDWGLLATFAAFFTFSGNLARMEAVHILFARLLSHGTILISALTCQIISNVPAAILLSRFTQDACGLLVGVNVGGAGTLVASLASLITFREYTHHVPNGGKQFLFLFSGISFAFLTILLAAMSFLNG